MKTFNCNPACPLPPADATPIAVVPLHEDARIGLKMEFLFYRVEEFPTVTGIVGIMPANPASPYKVVVYVRSVFAKIDLTLIGEYDRDYVESLDADALIAPCLAGFRAMAPSPLAYAYQQAACDSGAENIMAPCLICHEPFLFNPATVPSLRADPDTYESRADLPKQPVCKPCYLRCNEERRRHGLAPWTIHPRAYDLASGPEATLSEN